MPVCHFTLPDISSEFSENEDNSLSKKALILAEGEWKDSKKRLHNFSRQRLKLIAKNTNVNFNRGIRIPVLKDHVKTQDSNIGDLNSPVEIRVIQSEDLPNSKHQDLIGRLGIFAHDVKIKARSAIEQIKEGLVSTISPGVDIVSNCIREISVTPTPAIPGMALFNRYGNPILSWDETEDRNNEVTRLKEEFDELSETFFEIMVNIDSASEEELNGKDPAQLQEEALAEYAERLTELFAIAEVEETPSMAFSMYDVARLKGMDLANFSRDRR